MRWSFKAEKKKKKRSKKCHILIFKKDIWKKKKISLQWILKNVLENQTFQRAAKSIEMKVIVILVKVWNVQYLEIYASHWLLVETWMRNWMMKVFAGAEIWFIALWLENIQISGKTDYMRNSNISVLSKHLQVNECIFDMVFDLRESCRKSQICYI